MKFIKETEYLNYLKKCFPIVNLTAPFRIRKITLDTIIKDKPNWITPPQVITIKEFKEPLKKIGFEVLTWNNMHAKVLIGLNGALWGSWNFNMIHPTKSTERELVEFVKPNEKKYKQLTEQFDAWWKWQEINLKVNSNG